MNRKVIKVPIPLFTPRSVMPTTTSSQSQAIQFTSPNRQRSQHQLEQQTPRQSTPRNIGTRPDIQTTSKKQVRPAPTRQSIQMKGVTRSKAALLLNEKSHPKISIQKDANSRSHPHLLQEVDLNTQPISEANPKTIKTSKSQERNTKPTAKKQQPVQSMLYRKQSQGQGQQQQQITSKKSSIMNQGFSDSANKSGLQSLLLSKREYDESCVLSMQSSSIDRNDGRFLLDQKFAVNLMEAIKPFELNQSFVSKASTRLNQDSIRSTPIQELQGGFIDQFSNMFKQVFSGCCGANTDPRANSFRASSSIGSTVGSQIIQTMPYHQSIQGHESKFKTTDSGDDEDLQRADEAVLHSDQQVKSVKVLSYQSGFQAQIQCSIELFDATKCITTSGIESKNQSLKSKITQVIQHPQSDEDPLSQTLSPCSQNRLQTIQQLAQLQQSQIKPPNIHEIKHLLVKLPPSKLSKVLIFDLDETLIHCVDDLENEEVQVIIPIKFKEEPESVQAGINIRPGVLECLQHANQFFQVIVFTASEQEYADPILDYLDPDNSLISARFYRNSCVYIQGLYVKDLRIFQKPLSHIAIVDNNIFAYAFQIDNGIPIGNYYSDENDKELSHLSSYLEQIAFSTDLRVKNRDAFQLQQQALEYIQQL